MSYTRIIAGFTVGFAVGATTLNILVGFHLDNAQLEIQQLQTLVADQAQQLTTLEQSLAARRQAMVRSFEVHVDFVGDRPDKDFELLELEQAVKNLLDPLRGQEVSSLDPLIIKNIVDRRTLKVGKHEFLLTIKGALVAEKIIMYIDAKEIKQSIPILKRESPPS